MAEESIYEVEHILARRRTRKGKLEYMVRWKNFGNEEDTWEPLENLGDCMELVEEFNRKTLKEGKFQRLASLDSIHKKQTNGSKKKQAGNGKGKVGQVKESTVNNSKQSSNKNSTNDETEVFFNYSRTKSDVKVGKNADGSSKAQKRKQEFDANANKQTNGPIMPPPATNTNSVKSDGPSPEKRIKRAHSVTGVVPPGSSTSGTSNGLGSPLQRRRLNSSMSNEAALRLSPKTSPILKPHISLVSSPYPKLVISPSKVIPLASSSRRSGSGAVPLASPFPGPGVGQDSRRTASIVARRRLSQSSPSAEDTIDSRRISARQSESLYKYKEIVVKKCTGYTQIRLFTTTPTRNALNIKALQELTNVFETSKKDDSKVIFLSGSGSVFCSGLDLRYVQTSLVEERKRASKNLADAVRVFVDSLINCPKIVVVAVNGPAIGLGAAILPLCDVAYASDKAYFHLPYSILGQTPEGCASHTFPQVLGLALAGEMLYAGRKLTALEACACGLVSHTFWPTSFMQEVIPRVQRIASQSGKALLQSKLLVKGQMRAKLEYVNERECAALEERWRSPECYRQIKLFAENYSDM